MLRHGLCHVRYALSEPTDGVTRCLATDRLSTCLVPLRHWRFFKVLKDLQSYWRMYSTPQGLIQELVDEISDDAEVRERLGQAWVDGIRKDIPWYVAAAYVLPDIDSGDALLLRYNNLSLPSVGGCPKDRIIDITRISDSYARRHGRLPSGGRRRSRRGTTSFGERPGRKRDEGSMRRSVAETIRS